MLAAYLHTSLHNTCDPRCQVCAWFSPSRGGAFSIWFFPDLVGEKGSRIRGVKGSRAFRILIAMNWVPYPSALDIF